ncbi:SGNH/GDSL hydrolase family protein [Aurantimonas marina]|uniref:SGNH/GDSL hydrolase family protein n=1 Tax=Aurantimonas marina TaxID=2780508 RepID=UPI001E304E5A|nr:SGNH family hydrolase [Aurantimonas marina]
MMARQATMTVWRRARLALVAAIAGCAVLITGLAPTGTVSAQERPRTVLEMLFGGGTRAAPERRVIRKKVIRKKKSSVRKKTKASRKAKVRKKARRSSSKKQATSRKSTTRASAAQIAEDEQTTKDANAQKVLVVGDFLADSLADGLDTIYGDNEMVTVESRINGSSGLVRDDFYDWPKNLGPIIDEEKPAVLVMMIGSNDRQPIELGSRTLSPRSEAWTKEYESRIGGIAEIVKNRNIPLIWVGMPSFKFERMSEDMVFLNDLYRKGATKVSGQFVDIWEGFVDANGNFVYSGPGVSGQQVQLRNSDGITMTEAGDDKMAFFAERAIARVLKNSASPLISLSAEQLPNMQLPPLGNAANAVTAAPMSIDDPALDGADTLLGGGTTRGFTLEPSPRDRLIAGNGTGDVQGRADNFAWNEKTRAVVPEGPPIAYRGSLDLNAVRASEGLKPPEEMPSILDAIIQDWNADSDAARGDGPAN